MSKVWEEDEAGNFTLRIDGAVVGYVSRCYTVYLKGLPETHQAESLEKAFLLLVNLYNRKKDVLTPVRLMMRPAV